MSRKSKSTGGFAPRMKSNQTPQTSTIENNVKVKYSESLVYITKTVRGKCGDVESCPYKEIRNCYKEMRAHHSEKNIFCHPKSEKKKNRCVSLGGHTL